MSLIAIPGIAGINDSVQANREINNLGQVAVALMLYASDHDGKYPGQLSELVKSGTLPDGTLLEFTDPETHQRKPWLYNNTLTNSSPGTAMLLAAPAAFKSGKRIVALIDGSVVLVTEAEFKKAWEGR